RYFEQSGLFGTPESCLPMIDQVRSLGVDEIACLIDFGIDTESVLASLADLNELRQSAHRPAIDRGEKLSVAEQIAQHGVTHLQCTPSLAGTLMLAPESARALKSLNRLLLGGEALPVALAQSIHELLPGRLLNM